MSHIISSADGLEVGIIMLLKNISVKQKILFAVIMLLIIAMLVIAWVETYWYCVEICVATVKRNYVEGKSSALLVYITDEYNDKVEEITIEDFNYRNIKDIEVMYRINGENEILIVWLKKTGKRECLKTIMKILELDFVEDVYYLRGHIIA